MHSLLFAAIVFCPPPCDGAEEFYRTVSTPRFTLYIENEQTDALLEDPVTDSLATESIDTLNKNFEELTRIFGVRPTKKVVLRFLSPEEFRRQTGSPAWTSAMFFRGEITIPLPEDRKVNVPQLRRAIRHEYVHAVVAELSGSRCPAWLDEGIAQLIEGKPNSVLGPALRRWVSHDDPLPLEWLDDGFMTLSSDLVPVAYAQSLFAARTLVNSQGFGAVRQYLQHLDRGYSKNKAFKRAFGRSRQSFEAQLGAQMRRWARSGMPHP